ncbi:MAG: hypothetical protein JXB04_00960 [Kiritimatiellae bacterium]|nr:hypothetical protein [Kiritimatiellia bacterium]
MPDWVIHLGVGAGVGRLFRLRNLRLFLFGSLLPDAAFAAAFLMDWDLLPGRGAALLTVILPLSSFFAYACLAAAVAVCADRPGRAFGLIFMGALIHTGLDLLQAGHVEMFLFPFSSRVWISSLFGYDMKLYGWIAGVAAVGLVAARFLHQVNDIRFALRRAWRALLPLSLLAVVIALSVPRLARANIHNFRYLQGGPAVVGAPATHVSALVIRSRPLTIVDCGREIVLDWPQSVEEGQVVAVWGTYDRSGNIRASKVVETDVKGKWLLTGLGIIFLALYWVRLPWVDDRARGRRLAA